MGDALGEGALSRGTHYDGALDACPLGDCTLGARTGNAPHGGDVIGARKLVGTHRRWGTLGNYDGGALGSGALVGDALGG